MAHSAPPLSRAQMGLGSQYGAYAPPQADGTRPVLFADGTPMVAVDARYLAALEQLEAAARAWARGETTTGLIAGDRRLREALAALPPQEPS